MNLAVVMPHVWRGGMLNIGILICNLLADDLSRPKDRKVTFYVPKDYDKSHIVNLSGNVQVKDFIQLPIKPNDIRFAHLLKNQTIPIEFRDRDHTYLVNSDGKPDLLHYDAILCLTGLFFHGPLLPLRPYVVYAPDFIQRIVPEIYGKVFESAWWKINIDQCIMMQNASAVIVTSPRTALDATSYAGVPRSRVHLLPMINSPLYAGDDNEEAQKQIQNNDVQRKYFLWVTNTAAHKNHVRAIKALHIYYSKYAGRLVCRLCGPQTSSFAEKESPIPHIREFIELNKIYKSFDGNLEIAGELSHDTYRTVLKNAEFLWHPVLYDNGTFSVIEAANLGVRSLVAAYPQMRFISDTFGINTLEFNPWSSDEMALSLKRMEDEIFAGVSEVTVKMPARLDNEFRDGLLKLFDRARDAFVSFAEHTVSVAPRGSRVPHRSETSVAQ